MEQVSGDAAVAMFHLASQVLGRMKHVVTGEELAERLQRVAGEILTCPEDELPEHLTAASALMAIALHQRFGKYGGAPILLKDFVLLREDERDQARCANLRAVCALRILELVSALRSGWPLHTSQLNLALYAACAVAASLGVDLLDALKASIESNQKRRAQCARKRA